MPLLFKKICSTAIKFNQKSGLNLAVFKSANLADGGANTLLNLKIHRRDKFDYARRVAAEKFLRRTVKFDIAAL